MIIHVMFIQFNDNVLEFKIATKDKETAVLKAQEYINTTLKGNGYIVNSTQEVL